jgi:Mg/Co/Ni transporter MgtE
MTYDQFSAGGMMTSEPVILPPDAAVAEALASIRQADLPPALAAQVYVCRPPTETPTGKYLGTCHFQRLLREPPSTLISSLLDTSVDPVRPDTPLADVTRDFAAYNLVAVPVVDEDNHLVGAVTIDDVVDHMLPPDWREQVGPDRVETTAGANDGPSTLGASDG